MALSEARASVTTSLFEPQGMCVLVDRRVKPAWLMAFGMNQMGSVMFPAGPD